METLYTKIKDDLLAKIKDGTYAEGDTIPTEVALAKQYDVSRPTIRQALQILVNEGYLDKRRRRGTVVTNPDHASAQPAPAPAPGQGGVQSFEDEIRRSGREVRTLPLITKETTADSRVAEGLEIAPGDPVYKIVRLRYVDNVPNVFMENYVPCKVFPGFLDTDFSETRLYERMRQLGHPVESIARHLEVSKADASTSTLLDVPIGDPLFSFRTIGRDAQGVAVEFSHSLYRGRGNSFEFVIDERQDTGSMSMPGPSAAEDGWKPLLVQ